MTDDEKFQEIIRDAGVLARRGARGRPPKVALSPEVAAMLDRVTGPETGDLPGITPEPAAVTAPPREEEAPAVYEFDPSEDSLVRIAEEVSGCKKCTLCATRTRTVPGEGNPEARIVFVGEAPGESEDLQGRPFVGRAGKLLTDIIEKGFKTARTDVFICNVLKCRPPGNRTPAPDEVAKCEPFLIRQLALIQPRVICALGGTAAQTLLKTAALVGRLRGSWHNYHGIPLRVTYHPAYLLRNPDSKRECWEDVKEILRLLDGEIPPPL